MWACTSITRNGSRCSEQADDSGYCSHHKQINRLLSLSGKNTGSVPTARPSSASSSIPGSKSPQSTTNSNSLSAGYSAPRSTTPPPASLNRPFSSPPQTSSSITSNSAGLSSGLSSLVASSKASYAAKERERNGGQSFSPGSSSTVEESSAFPSAKGMLPGEITVATKGCVFDFPRGLNLSGVNGTLSITNYRVRFTPSNYHANSMHPLLYDATVGVPWACISKVGYPQTYQTNSYQPNGRVGDGIPTHVMITFKDLRIWYLKTDIQSMMVLLNNKVFIHSPASLFAFARGNRKDSDNAVENEGHMIYHVENDFARMNVDLGNGPFRITRINENYSVCPTYPKKLVVPANVTDAELMSVAEHRSKGRLAVLCWVHSNSASIWRCAQPKRGIFNSTCPYDTHMLACLGRSNHHTNNIWIVDCRPELNARANNFTGGGTESSSIRHASVTFMNIANIHAMRESINAIRALANSTSTDIDMNFLTRVEETKWLTHIRLVLSAALRVAHAVENNARTVLVHCSDGWDRTGQICALSQMLLDPHYRTLTGFMQIIEKEWIRVGHKFNDRIGPGISENDEQSPVFIQFLDCCWQLLTQYPTYFEFNSKSLQFVADNLFSARFGTFLCNCDRERQVLNVPERTPSLWTYMTAHRSEFVNPFYRAPRSSAYAALLPPIPSVLRRTTVWSEYYFRSCPIQSFPNGNFTPPLYGQRVQGGKRDWEQTKTVAEDVEATAKALQERIAELEAELRQAKYNSSGVFTTAPPAPATARVSRKSSILDQGPPIDRIDKIREDAAALSPSRVLSMEPTRSSSANISTSMTTAAANTASLASTTSGRGTVTVNSSSSKGKAQWRCAVCSKVNGHSENKCIICGRPSTSLASL